MSQFPITNRKITLAAGGPPVLIYECLAVTKGSIIQGTVNCSEAVDLRVSLGYNEENNKWLSVKNYEVNTQEDSGELAGRYQFLVSDSQVRLELVPPAVGASPITAYVTANNKAGR